MRVRVGQLRGCGGPQGTARLYSALGLPEYEALEAFVEYDAHSPSLQLRPAGHE
jgi:hypothetical protein